MNVVYFFIMFACLFGMLAVSAVASNLTRLFLWCRPCQVRVALQMEDGSRLQGSFSSGQSLWELITHFPQIRCKHVQLSVIKCVDSFTCLRTEGCLRTDFEL